MLYQTILLTLLCTIHVQADEKQACQPIPPALTSPKTGQKAWDKCVEYQELVFPCEKDPVLGGTIRKNHCGHNSEELIVGDNVASNNEFPHVVLLGYGNLSDIKWLCGGAMVSEKFILTTGHCISSREFGPITHVLFGVIDAKGKFNENNLYKIKNIIRHPEYKPPKKYHDIALLETEKQIELNQFRVPACLSLENPEGSAIETSYVLSSYNAGSSNKLRKVQIRKFTTEKCMSSYPQSRLLMRGIDETTQMCYGQKNESTAGCEVDSGGPLQVRNKKLQCMYDVIGLASFGRPCGFTKGPVVYTKVSHYLPWIESIVWP